MPDTDYQSETVLEDDYPVFAGYAYVADGRPIESPVQGTVQTLKQAVNAKEIRRCDIVGRMLDADSGAQQMRDAQRISRKNKCRS